MTRRLGELSVVKLRWLLADNSAYLDEFERVFPGAGVGLEEKIMERIRELEEA